MDYLGNLPIEIIQEIFKYLSATDLSNCARVNTKWRNGANSDILWRPLCIQKGIICQAEYYNADCELDPLVDWAHAYMTYVLTRLANWRSNVKQVTTVNSCYGTIACCDSETLVFTNQSKMIFVYNVSRHKPHCVQTIIPECYDRDILALELTRRHLIVRQGDTFALYSKVKHKFILKGYFLRVDDSYVFTQSFHETDHGEAPVKFAVLDNGLALSVRHSLFICNIQGTIEVHEVTITDPHFFLHDHFRVYAETDPKTVSGFNVQMDSEDHDLDPQAIIALKSNKHLVVGLISFNNTYSFQVWYVEYGLRTSFTTHRPFGFETHTKRNMFAAVALDKFNLRLLLTVYDLDFRVEYEIELDNKSVAQAKLYFFGRDLLYCATRCDWDIYDHCYVIDLRSMHILYEEDIGPTNIVSIDTKHAVFNHGDIIEIQTYF